MPTGMTEGESRARKWWEIGPLVAKLVPEGKLNLVLLAALGAAGLLLVLTIVGFVVASGRGSGIEAERARLAAAQEQIATLQNRPTQAQFAAAKTLSKRAELRLGEKASEIESLEGKLAAEQRKVGELATSLGVAKSERTNLTELSQKLGMRLRELTARHETVRRSTSGKTGLLATRLEEAGRRIVDLELRVTRETNRVAETKEAAAKLRRDHDLALQEAEQEVGRRDKLIQRLKDELADIPVVPLPDELAKEQYREILEEVARHEDREERVDILFHAKLVLAGSSYERKADTAWRKERRGEQADVDRAAKAVFGDVSSRVRLHPQAHDDNIRHLKEAMEKVQGSKFYEDRIRKLIDREHELKAEGR